MVCPPQILPVDILLIHKSTLLRYCKPISFFRGETSKIRIPGTDQFFNQLIGKMLFTSGSISKRRVASIAISDIQIPSSLVDISSISDVKDQQDLDQVFNSILVYYAPTPNAETFTAIMITSQRLDISNGRGLRQTMDGSLYPDNSSIVQLCIVHSSLTYGKIDIIPLLTICRGRGLF